MAGVTGTVDTRLPRETVFDLLADFRSVAAWDPSVRTARRLDRGELGRGSRFCVELSFLGRPVALTYEIMQAERPERLVLEARGQGFRSLDTLVFEEMAAGTRLTYDAQILFEGWARLFDLPAHGAFQLFGRQSLEGLRRYLDAPASGRRSAA